MPTNTHNSAGSPDSGDRRRRSISRLGQQRRFTGILSTSSWVVVGVLVLVLIVVGLYWTQSRNKTTGARPGVAVVPASEPAIKNAYGGSSSCEECHPEQYAAWKNSHHGLAERLPSASQDEVAFRPNRTFRHGTQHTTALKQGERYGLISAGLQSTGELFLVERILGNSPLRQALVPFPRGRLQATEAAWDPRSNEWFNVYGEENRQPGEWGHWTGRGMNWNSMCARCHNTRLRKNYLAETDTYATAMAETGVGCEACHGPMHSHNAWQAVHKGQGLSDPTIRRFSRDEMFDTCAGCHARRTEITPDVRPGDSFFDHHLLSIVDDSSLFYADGQIRDEDYEVTPFLGSRMYHKGVRCVDCHDVHTMKTRVPGNFLCLTCHGPGSTNAPVISPVEHAHHRVHGYDTNGVLVDSDLMTYIPARIPETGGECVNCHMPQTAYMQRHWRHDHGFTIPDPLLTKELGIPNACNRCHADQSVDWSAEFVEKWYGPKMNHPYRQRARAVGLARRGESVGRDALLQMLAADEFPYWRAVAGNLLQRWSGESLVRRALVQHLQDTHPLVRQMVIHGLGSLAESGDAEAMLAVQHCLEDPFRNVRIAAARHLAGTLDLSTRAGKEYMAFLDYVSDQPLGQMQSGVFELARRRASQALNHFQKAVEWDPFSAGLRHELAVVLSQLGRAQEAVQQLETAVKLAPDDAEFVYKLALALNDAGATEQVRSQLERAVQLDPRHARAWYNLGLARSAAQDNPGAIEALLRAESIDSADARIPYARATILARLGRWDEARTVADRALAIDPQFRDAAVLIQQMSRRSY